MTTTPADLSRLDLADDEVLKDFEHELRRCQNEAQKVALIDKWGEPILRRLWEVLGERHD